MERTEQVQQRKHKRAEKDSAELCGHCRVKLVLYLCIILIDSYLSANLHLLMLLIYKYNCYYYADEDGSFW